MHKLNRANISNARAKGARLVLGSRAVSLPLCQAPLSFGKQKLDVQRVVVGQKPPFAFKVQPQEYQVHFGNEGGKLWACSVHPSTISLLAGGVK